VSRLIPAWIGNVKVPENRETTEQLLLCWAQLLNEVTNVKPLLRKLKDKMVEKDFIAQASEISIYLSHVLEDKKVQPTCETDIYTGNPLTMVGYFNSRTAGVLHYYFDKPDVKLRKPSFPMRK
jgi:hypothetical protein